MKYKHIITFVIFSLICFNTFSKSNLIPFRKGDKWGYSNVMGKIIIPAIYDSVSLFKYQKHSNIDMADVILDHKFGVINSVGKLIVPLKYDVLYKVTDDYFGNELNRIIVGYNNKYGVIDFKNQVIAPSLYDTIITHSNWKSDMVFAGLDFYCKIGNEYFMITNEGEKKKTTADIFNSINDEGFGDMSSSPARSQSEDIFKMIPSLTTVDLSLSKFKGVIDSLSVDYFGDYCLWVQVFYNGKVGAALKSDLLKDSIQILIKPIFDFIDIDRERFRKTQDVYNFIVKKDGLFSIVDFSGVQKMPFKYSEIDRFNSNYAITKKEDKIGYYGFFDKIDILPKYNFISDYFTYEKLKLFHVKVNNKWGYINQYGFEYFSN